MYYKTSKNLDTKVSNANLIILCTHKNNKKTVFNK